MRTKIVVLICFTLLLTLGIVPFAAAQDALGSEANPIQVYFVPSVEAQVIATGGQVMADALNEATGLFFVVNETPTYPATVEAMCNTPDSAMGFIPALGYVIASDRCGVDVAAAAVRNGWNVYWTEYIVRRDSDIYTFGDLAGRSWAFPDSGSTSGYLVPAVELQAAGIEPGDQVEAGGHPQVVQAVYNGEVEFGTTFYSPPLMPEGHSQWGIGDIPEPYDLTIDESHLVGEGDDSQLFVGDIRILDARQNIRTTSPDVVDQVKILRLSSPIPNDTLSFGPDFPEELRQQVIDALIAFSATEGWAESLGSDDFYGWSSIAPITDSAYDPVRQRIEILGLTEDDIFG